MLQFKEYLNETKWAGSLSDKLFDVGIGLSGLWLPMSTPIFRRIGLDDFRTTCFHVTDTEGYEGIKKMQGQKSQFLHSLICKTNICLEVYKHKVE